MQTTPLLKLKKNSKLIRLSRLYFDLIKTKRILTFFMGGLKGYQLRKLYRTVSTRHHFLSLLTALEYRLEFILYKAGFVLTGKQARQLILHGQVLVNHQPITAYGYSLQLDDMISLKTDFIITYKPLLVCHLLGTPGFFNFLKQKRILKKVSLSQVFMYVKFPCFLESNFKTFNTYLVRKPVMQECFLPNILSVYDVNQLYFVL